MNRRVFLLLALACAAVAGGAALRAEPAASVWSRVQIVRDEMWVPHITAKDPYALGYGHAWAQAEDHADRMREFLAIAGGRAAELYGDGVSRLGVGSNILVDGVLRALRAKELALIELDGLGKPLRAYIDGFVDGLNGWYRPRGVEPVQAYEVVALTRLVNLAQYLGIAMSDVYARRGGSNQWAVAASRCAAPWTGLHVSDPHLDIGGITQWWLVHLRCTSDELPLDVAGGTFFGIPSVVIGRNATLAWSLTRNEPDVADAWRVSFDPADRLKYRHAGGWRDASEQSAEIPVRGAAPVTLSWRTTHHGPVISDLAPILRNFAGEGNGLAMRFGGWEDTQSVTQFMRIAQAKDTAAFVEALKLKGIPLWNFMATDSAGRIAYVHMGAVHKRNAGVLTDRILDGSDPVSDWGDRLPFDQLPKTIDPPSGVMVNCNQPPWTVCPEAGKGRQPEAWVARADSVTARGIRAAALLGAKPKLTLGDMREFAADCVSEIAASWAKRFRTALATWPDALPAIVEPDSPLAEAVEALRNWDGAAAADSLAAAWFHRAVLWKQKTDDRLATEDDLLDVLMRFVETAAEIEAAGGDVSAVWGTLHVLERGSRVIPAPGFSGLSSLRMTGDGRVADDGTRFVRFGSGLTIATGFRADGTAESHVSIALGQSERESSPHYDAFSRLWSKRELYRLPWTAEEIAASALSVRGSGEWATPGVRVALPGSDGVLEIRRGIAVMLADGRACKDTLALDWNPGAERARATATFLREGRALAVYQLGAWEPIPPAGYSTELFSGSWTILLYER